MVKLKIKSCFSGAFGNHKSKTAYQRATLLSVLRDLTFAFKLFACETFKRWATESLISVRLQLSLETKAPRIHFVRWHSCFPRNKSVCVCMCVSPLNNCTCLTLQRMRSLRVSLLFVLFGGLNVSQENCSDGRRPTEVWQVPKIHDRVSAISFINHFSLWRLEKL